MEWSSLGARVTWQRPALLLQPQQLPRQPGTWRQLPRRRRLFFTPRLPALLVAASTASDSGGQEQPAPAAAWLESCSALAMFAAQHGRLPRAAGTEAQPLAEGERALGLWCADQQRRKDGGKGPPLSRAESSALAAIPGWGWARKRHEHVPWEQRLQQVTAFVAQHGRLPRTIGSKLSPIPPSERQLGKWCDRQRQRSKGQGNYKPLTPQQQAALAAIPGWYWAEFEIVPWEQQLQQVAAFAAQHGRLPRLVGSQQAPLVQGERRLGQWCASQRQRWKGNVQPPLSAEQHAALQAIPGWVWECYELWDERLQAVAAFVAQHGRLPRRQDNQQEALLLGEQQLGMWCHTQRQRRKGQGTWAQLSPEQQAALEGIPGWFWEQWTEVPWEQRLQQVAAFVAQHGRLPRRRGSQRVSLLQGEQQLGHWCGTQRQRRKGNRHPGLTHEQQAALEAIPGWRW